MQSFKKRDKSSCLRWIQVLSISGHVTSALNYLANELVFGEPHCHAIECGAALATTFSEGVTITALLYLKN
jgi:hypothetical protein